MIFDNPTQGVDVGAKEDIYDIILKLAEEGVAVVMLSSEAQEIIRLCDRAAGFRSTVRVQGEVSLVRRQPADHDAPGHGGAAPSATGNPYRGVTAMGTNRTGKGSPAADWSPPGKSKNPVVSSHGLVH